MHLIWKRIKFVLIIFFLFLQSPYAKELPPIIIGVPTSLGTIEGRDSWRAVQLAVYEINKKGGVKLKDGYHPLRAYAIDTRGAEAGVPVYDALMALEKLILEKRPDAIVVGASRSEVLLASMDLIAKYKIPYICTIALTPDFEKKLRSNYQKYKYMFRLSIDARYVVSYFESFLEYLAKEKHVPKKVYILVQDVLWTRETGNAIKGWLKNNGWNLEGFDIYPMGSRDFSSSLFKIRLRGVKVVLGFFDMPNSLILVKQFHSMHINALLTGIISPATPEYAWDSTDGAVENMVLFVLEPGPIPIRQIPKSLEFHKKYGKFFGEDARRRLSCHGAGCSYDAVYVLVNAMERAGTKDPDKVVEQLEKTDMYGVIGRIRFSKEHQLIFGYDPKKAAIGCLFQWKKGRRVPVFPKAISEGEVKIP